MDEPICFYESKYYMFSNFSAFAVEWRGRMWMTSEHAYQAAKFSDETIIEKILHARSAHDAKKVARSHEAHMIANFKDMKLEIMREIVRAKYDQHEYIQKKLIETGEKEIIENSPQDDFWGWGPNKDGKNHLGKLWMQVRDEVRKSEVL